MMRLLHLVVGVISVAAFLASGQYMDRCWDHLRGMDDTRRMLFRSTHIYLLFAALLNVVLGLYFPPGPSGWRIWMRRGGSVLLLIAPPLFAVGFLTEPWLTGLERPYSRPAIFGTVAGVVMHMMSCWPPRRG